MTRYDLESAAAFIGIKPYSLRQIVRNGTIDAEKEDGKLYFAEEALKEYQLNHSSIGKIRNAETQKEARRRRFDSKYGKGSYEKLLELPKQSCVSYQQAAQEIGVSRERARQLHDKIYPERAKTGHQRKHVCAIARYKKELFEEKLFRKFYRAARRYFSPESIEPVPRQSGGKFSKRIVKLNGKTVLLRQIIRTRSVEKTLKSRHHIYRLWQTPRDTDYQFYHISGADFLFMPSTASPHKMTSFTDIERSKYHRFKNNFDALKEEPEEAKNY